MVTNEKSYVNIDPSTTELSADQRVKEDAMLDQQKITILYCRLSNEDAMDGESNSIQNQRELLTRYAQDHGYTNIKVLVDKSTPRLIQFYTFKNAVKPPFLGGFFVFGTSAA